MLAKAEWRGAPRESSQAARFFKGIKRWLAREASRRQMRAQIDSLDRADLLDEVLRDCSMSRSDVGAIIDADPETPRRLGAMLAQFDLTERVHNGGRSYLREIEKTCLLCQSTDRCDRWLGGDKAEPVGDFCGNAETFEALHGRK